jgi:hypothetical protein
VLIASSRQFVEQRLRLFEIGGVEPLGQSVIDRREKIAGFATAALLGPQPRF